jgi:hypothetical protein
MIVTYNATNSLERFENKHILFSFKNALAYRLQRRRCIGKLGSQSYDHGKNLQRK